MLYVMGAISALLSGVIGTRMILNLREAGKKQLEITYDGAKLSTLRFN